MRSAPFTVKEAAMFLRVSDKTVRRWLAEGMLTEQSRDPSGRILINAASIEAVAAQHGLMPRQDVQPVQSLATVEALGDVSAALAQAWRERDERLIALAEQVGRLELELDQARAENERLRAELATQAPPSEPVYTPVQVSNQPERGMVLRRILRRLGIG